MQSILDIGLKARIEAALYSMERDPFSTDVKKLIGNQERWRVRVGDWRIVFTIEQGQLLVLVIAIAKRGDVYRLIER